MTQPFRPGRMQAGRGQAIKKWRARLRTAPPSAEGHQFQPHAAEPADADRPVLRVDGDPLRLRGLLRRRRRRDRRRRGDRRGLDGRIARLLKATSRFGAEFDSLSDFLCFGVAPALVLYFWTLEAWRGFGYAPCLLFAVCAALRLARFNSALDAGPGPAYRQHFFTGVPAPAGAMRAAVPAVRRSGRGRMGQVTAASLLAWPGVSALVLTGAGALMVSTLPTWSFKNFRLPETLLLPLLIAVGLYAAFLVSEPWGAMALGGIAGRLDAALQSAQLPPPEGRGRGDRRAGGRTAAGARRAALMPTARGFDSCRGRERGPPPMRRASRRGGARRLRASRTQYQRSKNLTVGMNAHARLIAAAALMGALSQFHRNALGVIAPEVAAELGLDPAGRAANAMFFIALLVLQLPIGIAFDRYGATPRWSRP